MFWSVPDVVMEGCVNRAHAHIAMSYLILVLVTLWIRLPVDGDLLRLVVHVRGALWQEDGQRLRGHVARGRPGRHAAGYGLHHNLVYISDCNKYSWCNRTGSIRIYYLISESGLEVFCE